MCDTQKIVSIVASGTARKATKYVSPKLVIKATARHKPRKDSSAVEIVLTIGKPNYREREFIKMALKAGEPFPIRKVQLQLWRK